MKYLTLIRHAKSSWDDATLKDHDRPLNERGLRNAPMVGRFLARTYFGGGSSPPLLPKPDKLISSTALRARRTAEIMTPELGVEPPILAEKLYLAEPKVFLQVVRGFDDAWRHAMVFGHNPGISEFAERLVKRGEMEEMPTCAVALIELPWDAWSAADWDEGRLLGYITPKLIEKRFAQAVSTRPEKE